MVDRIHYAVRVVVKCAIQTFTIYFNRCAGFIDFFKINFMKHKHFTIEHSVRSVIKKIFRAAYNT